MDDLTAEPMAWKLTGTFHESSGKWISAAELGLEFGPRAGCIIALAATDAPTHTGRVFGDGKTRTFRSAVR